MRFACQCSMLQRVAQPVGGQHCCCVRLRPDLLFVPDPDIRNANSGRERKPARGRGPVRGPRGWAGPPTRAGGRSASGGRQSAGATRARERVGVRCERFRVPDHASFVPRPRASPLPPLVPAHAVCRLSPGCRAVELSRPPSRHVSRRCRGAVLSRPCLSSLSSYCRVPVEPVEPDSS